MTYKVDTVALKKLMIENGIDTIGELAKRAGLNRNTTSAVVNGKCRPSTAVMDKLVAALNMESAVAGAIFFVPDLRNA